MSYVHYGILLIIAICRPAATESRLPSRSDSLFTGALVVIQQHSRTTSQRLAHDRQETVPSAFGVVIQDMWGPVWPVVLSRSKNSRLLGNVTMRDNAANEPEFQLRT